MLAAPLAVCSGQDFRADRSKTALIERKLSSVIIPKVEFQQTPIRDAIEFLREEFRRLDTEDEPDRRGVSMFLKLKAPTTAARPAATAEPTASGLSANASGEPAAPASADPAGPRITLSLSNVSFLAALRAVASQAGLKVEVETYAVALIPVDELSDALITAEFKVAPEAFGVPVTPPFHSKGTAVERFNAMPWLKQKGVTFPPGASAIYVMSRKRLVVRNTEENIDRIEDLVSLAHGSLPVLDLDIGKP